MLVNPNTHESLGAAHASADADMGPHVITSSHHSASQHGALENILQKHPSCIDNLLENICTCYNLADIKARLTQLDEASDEEETDVN